MEQPPDQQPPGYQPARSARTQVSHRFGIAPVWLVIGSIGIILILVFGVTRLVQSRQPDPEPTDSVARNSSPGIDGIIAEKAPASQFEVGDCLAEFSSPLEPATIVTCSTPHAAQLIGLETLEDVPFPGDPRVTTKAEEACRAIELDPEAALEGNWNYAFSRPSSGTWEAGDRSVACFLALEEGTTTVSLLPASETTST
ncbi:MAG: septum formation family protein [Arthrobacter sp.]|uniref:septum formation family protein n=1 Tax=unclassified Arthrobacter TaxID=235627 RepID=UPI00264C82EE|nr:septum formation family protein [Micrococcaceae bacterium]MDN5812189.1 septum formation family protein [Micrococcaceae bacterium]MDN5823277.1 septum formation family protein [Micrococcaceae bacterium]MDN5879123.1 septum formation family protein [Micrococcaceae bacterium]MDN5886821.1 septum formation family protein [Micrococcaceae bacterium]